MPAILLLFLGLSLLNGPGAAFADFTNLDDLPATQAPATLDRAKLASVSIGGCMGTFISNDGYLITALHCATGFPIFEGVPVKEFATDLLRVDPAKLRLHPTIGGQIGLPMKPVAGRDSLLRTRVSSRREKDFSRRASTISRTPKKILRNIGSSWTRVTGFQKIGRF